MPSGPVDNNRSKEIIRRNSHRNLSGVIEDIRKNIESTGRNPALSLLAEEMAMVRRVIADENKGVLYFLTGLQ